MHTDVIGTRYVDDDDSGDLVMEVAALDAFTPNTIVWVRPIDSRIERVWWRSISAIMPRIEAYPQPEQKA